MTINCVGLGMRLLLSLAVSVSLYTFLVFAQTTDRIEEDTTTTSSYHSLSVSDTLISSTDKENETEEEESDKDEEESVLEHRLKETNVTFQIQEKDGGTKGKLPLPEGYNKEEIPLSSHQKKPLNVAVFVNINSINAMDHRNEKITIELDLYVFWADKRFHLNNNGNFTNNSTVVVQVQELHKDFVDTIWTPDLIIENGILVPHNDLTSQPLVSFNSETGFVKYSRLEVTSPCPMSFFFYPLDTQKCEITLRSYQHPSNSLSLNWVHTGVFLKSSNNSNFDIKVDSATREQRSIKTINFPNLLDKVHLSNVKWTDKTVDVLKLMLSFRRHVSFHLAQTYLPSIFFIVITWSCFLLPADMCATRIYITMTTLLTINTMFNSVREQSPQVTYAKAIDIWMVSCVLFAFLSLLEFAFMSWLDTVKEREEKIQKEHADIDNKVLKNELCTDEKLQGNEKCQAISIQSSSDKPLKIKGMNPKKLKIILQTRKFLWNHGLLLLSSVFVGFNAIYWAWLCSASEYLQWTVDDLYNGK